MFFQDKPEKKDALQEADFYLFISWYVMVSENWLVVHFFSLDEKKRTKEKSRQNNASTRIVIAPPAVLSGQRAHRNNTQTNNILVSLLS